MILLTGLQIGPITVMYTNYRGETGLRTIKPHNLYWGCNEWHPEPQWLMDAWDADKKLNRTFAMANMRPANPYVRVWFKDKNYMDVRRDLACDYETQPDWDHTEEIPSYNPIGPIGNMGPKSVIGPPGVPGYECIEQE